MKRKRPIRPSFMVVSAAVVSAATANYACSSSSNGTTSDAGEPPSSTNPGIPGCPATQPTQGDPCAIGTGTNCSYDGGVTTNACGSFPNTTTVTCTNGKWAVGPGSITTCNPGLPPDSGLDASEAGDGGDGG